MRQLARNKVFSSLNILGLSLGMAMAILIATFIRNEFQNDTWMTDSDRVYRVFRVRDGNTAWTPARLAEKMRADYPEVESTTGYAPHGEHLISYKGNETYEEEIALVDSTFFEVLKMDFLYGDPKTALDQPNAMVITDRFAKQIFGAANPMGEVIQYDSEDDYIITGVLDIGDKQSHITSNVYKRFQYYSETWRGNNRATYALLKPGTNPEVLAQKIDADVTPIIQAEFERNGVSKKAEDLYRWALQPLSDVYLKSVGYTSITPVKGSIRRVYIFGMIAMLILLVAIINYINLTTARATQRSKEVGVKKVSGADRSSLTAQFITESIFQALVAGVFALLIAEITLPLFNSILDRELQVLFGDPLLIIFGTLASYPAFVMSAYRPVTALKSNFMKAGKNGMFRKVLVTSQFTVTITLLIVMAFIYRQVNYMNQKDLGFKASQVMTIPLAVDTTFVKLYDMKEQFKQIPGVEEVVTASFFPGSQLPDWNMLIQGNNADAIPRVLFAGGDFDECLDIEMVEGRFIDDEIQDDWIGNFVVNEEFVRRYNVENPIGAKVRFDWQEEYGQIVGVMKDFHYLGLSEEIEPLVMNARGWRSNLGIKLSTANLDQTIESIKNLWTQVEPEYPLRYSFLDEDFAMQYADQQRFGKAIQYSTLLTLFIALLGLFGLTAFTVERRSREIGVRKVLGATVAGIVSLLAKDFMKLIGIAAVIAIPLAYFLANQWLADFAYRTQLVWWVFAGAGLLILGVGFLTVVVHSMRAALTNPVDSLRSE